MKKCARFAWKNSRRTGLRLRVATTSIRRVLGVGSLLTMIAHCVDKLYADFALIFIEAALLV